MKFNPIGWTHFTINFWWGCTEVSRACQHCYARDFAKYVSRKLFGTLVEWGKGKPRFERLAKARTEALALNRQAEKKGTRYHIFANSMSDWLDDEVPAEWLNFLLETIRLTPLLDWQLLTKRPENWEDRMIAAMNAGGSPTAYQWQIKHNPPSNVWLGTTVESQRCANERIPLLAEIPAIIRFLSCEPLMEPLTLTVVSDDVESWSMDALRGLYWLDGRNEPASRPSRKIHWVIAGGESGNAKDLPGKPPTMAPLHPDWIRSLRDQCAAAQVPFYFKQWGEWLPLMQDEPGKELTENKPGYRCPTTGLLWLKAGTKAAGHYLDGQAHREFPETAHLHEPQSLRADS